MSDAYKINTCPTCGAKPHESCIGDRGAFVYPHEERVKLVYDPEAETKAWLKKADDFMAVFRSKTKDIK